MKSLNILRLDASASVDAEASYNSAQSQIENRFAA